MKLYEKENEKHIIDDQSNALSIQLIVDNVNSNRKKFFLVISTRQKFVNRLSRKTLLGNKKKSV